MKRINCDDLISKIRKYIKNDSNKELLSEAADKIEQLQTWLDDSTNDHFTWTLEYYFSRCNELEEKIEKLILKESEDPCKYCVNYKKCPGRKCSDYISGKGCVDSSGKQVDCNWSCMDFDFGTCSLLENTPCNGCVDDCYKNFAWNGNI